MKQILLIIILCLSLFSNSNYSATQDKAQLDLTLSLISAMSETVHSLQQERGASCGYISSKGKKFKIKLGLIKNKTNKKIKFLQNIFKKHHKILKKYVSYEQYVMLNKIFKNY